jgi:two-component system secretion response regulator SsrB
VLLADRNLGLTEGMRDLLKTTFGTVVMVADESSLFDCAERLEPLVVVIDLALTDGGGLDLIARWHGRFPEVHLVVLSIHDEATVARTVFDAGANAFVLKRAIATDLLDAVEVISSGENYVSPAIGELPSSQLPPASSTAGDLADLLHALEFK